MANHFVKASFVLTVTDAEAEVFRDIDEAAEIVRDSDVEQDRRVAAYSARSAAFRSCFPPAEADAFGGLLAIFSDPDYTRLGFTLQVDPSEGGSEAVREGKGEARTCRCRWMPVREKINKKRNNK